MYYEYQSWYDPSIGRFISQDPLGGVLSVPQSLNPYVYVGNLPTSRTDPTGAASCPGFDTCEGGGYQLLDVQPLSQEELDSITDPFKLQVCEDNPFVCRGMGYVNDENLVTPPDTAGSGTTVSTDTGPITVSDTPTPTIDANPTIEIHDIPRGGFEEFRGGGALGNPPQQLAEGNYVDRYVKPELQSQGYETSKSLGGVFPDAYREGEIVEIKPYHAGTDPYVEYGQQINRCLDAYRLAFPGEVDPVVRFILYRLI